MMANKNLNDAKEQKNDEFYTRLSDIENELRHYKVHFKGKTVLCNCDDPYESNFFKYFAMNFNVLGLKKLICTCYAKSKVIYTQLSLFGDEEEYGRDSDKVPYVIQITNVKDFNGDGAIDLQDVELLLKSKEGTPRKLKGDGDFRSDECVELLKEADIVVTNPPFSLFREYVAQLMNYGKKFLIIGNMNAITYKEIFPLLMGNSIWLGYKPLGSEMYFDVQDEYKEYLLKNKKEGSAYKIINGVVMGRMAAACWFTNLDTKKRHEKLILWKKYMTDEYYHYDNYDAINIDKVSDIPLDYEGVMGVPITFLDNYNSEQFDILGMTDRNNPYGLTTKIYTKEDCHNYSDCNRRGAIKMPDGTLKSTYARIFIRRKQYGNQT